MAREACPLRDDVLGTHRGGYPREPEGVAMEPGVGTSSGGNAGLVESASLAPNASASRRARRRAAGVAVRRAARRASRTASQGQG
jgi:hypothetical protein